MGKATNPVAETIGAVMVPDEPDAAPQFAQPEPLAEADALPVQVLVVKDEPVGVVNDQVVLVDVLELVVVVLVVGMVVEIG